MTAVVTDDRLSTGAVVAVMLCLSATDHAVIHGFTKLGRTFRPTATCDNLCINLALYRLPAIAAQRAQPLHIIKMKQDYITPWFKKRAMHSTHIAVLKLG